MKVKDLIKQLSGVDSDKDIYLIVNNGHPEDDDKDMYKDGQLLGVPIIVGSFNKNGDTI